MKRLTIAHINFSDNSGGAASIMNDLIKVHLAEGNTALRYCARPSLKDTRLLGFGIGPKAGLCLKLINKISTLRNRIFGDTEGVCENNYYRKLLDAKADIFHIHNIHGGWFPLRLIVRLSKIAPIVWTLHDEWAYTGHCVYTLGCSRWKVGCGNCPNLSTMVKMWRDTTANNQKNRAMTYQLLSSQSAAVVAVSEWLALRVKESDIWPGSVDTIPNGVKLDRFYPVPKHTARDKLGIAQDSSVILCCAAGGTSNPFKNSELVIEAFKLTPGSKKITLVVIGGSTELPKTTLAQKTIIFAGYINDPDLLRNYYAAGDLLVYPTKADTFGLVPAEALACGTPVIASNVGGVPEVVIDGKNGSIMSREITPSMLSDTICQLLEDRNKLEKMRENGVQYIQENFSVERMSSRYLSLYHSLIAGKQRCQGN